MPSQAAGTNERQQLIIQHLEDADQELSGQDLHARLRASNSPMGLATVYRHLRQLQQRGQIRCRHLPSGEALFAPLGRDEHHITCVDCGETAVLNSCPVHHVDLGTADRHGFELLFHTLEFFGLCEQCKSRQRD
ncbi:MULTISPECIES: transcriptional repressor [unclassified Synechococcus]|jgi:Fur family ferric uptake transcriptional regulator|uniref:Fur family transcriptional regulator n=1 Tax=unclassified Synechococcus TaxID=2626047 RepID=UPI002001CD9F|nr:transcriptional repressor [Synechococcus sp. A10-1-5-1]UPM50064.1 transcriptional repressor [Synechococcus sp. A10-1-5-1]